MNQTSNNQNKNVAPQLEKVALLELTPREVRLVLAWHTPGASYEKIEEYIEPIKVYEDMERDGYIKPTQIANTIAIVKMFRKLCDSMHVAKAIAYASSVFREAKNHYGFLEELEIASGFKMKLMHEEDEIAALYTAVVNSVDLPKGVIISVEDEVTRLIWYVRKTIVNTATISFGAETLATLFVDGHGSTEDQCQAMYDFMCSKVREIQIPHDVDCEDIKYIGVGDAFDSLGKISRKGRRYPLQVAHNYVVNRTDIENVHNAIKNLELDKMSKIKGISKRSAGAVGSGLAIIRAVRDVLGADAISIANVGIHTGVLYNQCVPMSSDKPISDLLLYSLACNCKYYGNGLNNGMHVYTLAMMLFRQLRVMHKLARQHIRALKIACFMHDCGQRIKFNASKKDALYVVLNSNIMGATHRDLVLGAFVAASQNSEDFNLAEWVKYKDIVDEEDIIAVKRLAVLLRIAVGLDITGAGNVKEVICDVLGDSVILKTVSEEDVTFELRCASDACNDFRKVFEKNLELI
ncbi:MAG: hypothetical protein IKC79_02370 [Clostridia bacterium]|nr:hypothetical protein [Clostridia bacterium]